MRISTYPAPRGEGSSWCCPRMGSWWICEQLSSTLSPAGNSETTFTSCHRCKKYCYVSCYSPFCQNLNFIKMWQLASQRLNINIHSTLIYDMYLFWCAYLSIRFTEYGGTFGPSSPLVLFPPHEVPWGLMLHRILCSCPNGHCGLPRKLGTRGKAEHGHWVPAYVLLDHEATKLHLLQGKDHQHI